MKFVHYIKNIILYINKDYGQRIFPNTHMPRREGYVYAGDHKTEEENVGRREW